MTDYHEHPLLEGFKDESNDSLIEAAIGQLDLARYISDGGKGGLSEDLKNLIREKFKETARVGLEMLLYHAILAAIKTNQKARAKRGKGSSIPPTAG